MHQPIQFKDLGLSFSHKTCFSHFSGQIIYGDRIAIIGRNGEGKSTLLKMLQGTWASFDGSLLSPTDLCIGYLPQLIEAFGTLSGSERLNRALTEALSKAPNLLLLDEPTNHLDKSNRRALMHHLRHYTGTLVMVTHDVELLKNLADTIWHIQHEKVHVFNGGYEDYRMHLAAANTKIENQLASLKQEKKEAHASLMQEQTRKKRKRIQGEKNIAERKWPTIRSHTKLCNAVKTGDERLHRIKEKKQMLLNELSELYQYEVIQPQFQLSAATQKTTIIIRDGSLGYPNKTILHTLNFHMQSKARVALNGNNGMGKSTFIKGILGKKEVIKTGEWAVPSPQSIGYLDQHYNNLHPEKTVFETVASLMTNKNHREIRKHLNDFLFRKNEEVDAIVANLSGGEKARLSLCCIAAQVPSLLILDEMTNNLDLETQEHVIQILKNYPGAMLVVSHDDEFLKAIRIETTYLIHGGSIVWQAENEHV